jgi:hypothetical protein
VQAASFVVASRRRPSTQNLFLHELSLVPNMSYARAQLIQIPPLEFISFVPRKEEQQAIYLVGLFFSVLRRGQRTDAAMPHKDLLGLQASNSLKAEHACGGALVCLIALAKRAHSLSPPFTHSALPVPTTSQLSVASVFTS